MFEFVGGGGLGGVGGVCWWNGEGGGGVQDYDHGLEKRERIYMTGYLGALPVGFFSDQENAIGYVSSLNTKDTPR